MSEDRTSVLGFAVPVAGAVLEPVALDPSQVVAGAPVVSELPEVAAGDVAVLAEGAQTRWTVHETLRKVYQVTV